MLAAGGDLCSGTVLGRNVAPICSAEVICSQGTMEREEVTARRGD